MCINPAAKANINLKNSMPKFSCPHCSQHIDAPDELAGTNATCPACEGAITVPSPERKKAEALVPEDSVNTPAEEKILYESHPKMFQNRPIEFVLSALLVLAYGVGLIIFLVWWIKVKGTKITLTNERVTLRKGILSKHINEVYHTDVRNVKLSQSFFQRIFKVGAIEVSTSGQSDVEISISGIPNPDKVKEIIDQHRRMKK